MLRSYLAGPMESVPNDGIEWRYKYKEELGKIGIDCIIPGEYERDFFNGINIKELKVSNTKKYKEIIREIIFQDLALIKEESDFVVVKWDGEQTSGTIDEVGYNFHELNRYNFLVTSLEPSNISGWFLSCFDKEFRSLNELIEYLDDENNMSMILRRKYEF